MRLKLLFLCAALLVVGADAVLLRYARGFHDTVEANMEGERLRLLIRAEERRSWRDYEPYTVPIDALANQVVLVRSPLADVEAGLVRARFFLKSKIAGGLLDLGSPWFPGGEPRYDPEDGEASGEKLRRCRAVQEAKDALRREADRFPWGDLPVAGRDTVTPEVASCSFDMGRAQSEINEALAGNVAVQKKLETAWLNTQSANRAARDQQRAQSFGGYGKIGSSASSRAAAPAYDVGVSEIVPLRIEGGPLLCMRRVAFTAPDGSGLPPLGPYFQGFEVDRERLARRDPLLLASLSQTRRIMYGAAALLFLLGTAGLYALHGAVASRLELARRRSEFTAAVSHELKAPLAGIRALAEMLHEGMVTAPEKVKEYVGNILHESCRLSRLIGNVLDSARLERKERSYAVGPADPAPAVREAVEIFRPHLAGRGFQLEVDIPETLPEVMIDRDALVQTIANLIDNAAKYTAPCPERRIAVRAGTGTGTGAGTGTGGVYIEVEDSGIGIAPEERPLLFEPYRRGRDPLARGTGGAGLGLSIAKSHVEGAMGGRIEVESQGEGKGSTFRVVLRA